MFKLLACSDLHLNPNNGKDYFRPRTHVQELRERSTELSSALDSSAITLAVHCGDLFDLSRDEKKSYRVC